MDSAQGRGGRQPQSNASNRRDPDLDRSSAKDGRSISKFNAHGGAATTPSKSSPSHLSPFNDSGAGLGIGDVLSQLKKQHTAGSASPKPRRTNDVATKSKAPKDDPSKKPKQTKGDNAVKNKSSKDITAGNSKPDKKTSGSKDKLVDEKVRRSKDTLAVESAKSQTPKNKRRAKSATRPKTLETNANASKPSGASAGNPSHDRRASIPVIRLSREDSKKQSEVSEDILDSPKFKRRLSVLSQAKLAFEKVAMAVTDAETVTVREGGSSSGERHGKDRKARSQSAPREVNSERAAKSSESTGKKKSHAKTLPRENDAEAAEAYSTEEEKSMQQSKQQQHRKTDQKRKDGRIKGEFSIEGVSTSSAPPKTSVISAPKASSNPLKLLHSITRPSSLASSSPRQSTPSRPRKKFSRGHIDQDPLEVDYEILDDRVTSIEPRLSIPSLDARRSIPFSESYETSAEEPLLSKHRESLAKQKLQREPDYTQPAPRPQSMPYLQTFPRTKQRDAAPPSQIYASATVDQGRPRKFNSSDRLRHHSSNQLGTPDSVFSPLFTVPSSSSFTSSDARSDVCLDLPDAADPLVSDLRLREAERDLKVQLGFPNAPYRRIVHPTDSSLCLAVLSAVLIFLLSFLLVWPMLVIILVVVPLVVFTKRLCSWLCCCGESLWGRCCLCICHTHLTSSELMWLGRGQGAGHSVAQSLMVLQKGLDTDRIRNLIDSRLLSVENRHGQKVYPRFTQKVVPFCCGQAWVTDKQFMVAKHVYNMPGYIETLEDLQQFISKMATQPLSLDHPLWEIQVLHNFREPRDTVLLFRMHLCMTDGVSIVHILENALVDTQKTSTRRSTFSSDAANTSPFKVLFSGPVIFLSRYLFGGQDFNLLHGHHVHSSGEMVVAWSEPFSLSAAMRVKQVARCSLSELLLSITAGNIRTYLQVSGITHPFNIRCALPVDFQSMDGGAMDMENKFSMVIIQLPTNTEGTIPRLWETKYKMAKFKSSAEAAIVNGTRWLSYCLLPISFFQELWREIYSRCTLMVANIAGPTNILKLDSREVKCMMYWVPPLDKVPLTVSFITYADQIRMAVISDRSVIPNPDLLTRDFNFKLENLSKLLAHRRIPGENSAANRHENIHLLSSFTLDDLTAEQIQLEMSLVQQELHEMKLQLEAGPSNHISRNDTELMNRIEALKERSRELMMHLRKRKADESEGGVIFSEEDDLESEAGGQERHQKPFRRRTLSMSSKMSSASVSSTHRPLSTASTSNLPSPIHTTLPSWPEADFGPDDLEGTMKSKHMYVQAQRAAGRIGKDVSSPVYNYSDIKGRYHNLVL